MKIKSDFVTNSSSSSFVVIGASVNVKDMLIKRGPEEDDVYGAVDRLLRGTGLEYSFGCNYDYDQSEVMIGITYTSMKDDETLGEFKTRVKNEIKETLGVDVEVDHIEECWMDN